MGDSSLESQVELTENKYRTMPKPSEQDALRKLMKAGSAKRKAAPSLSKHQLVDDLKKLKRAAGESARSTMVVDTPETEISKKPVSSKKQDKELTQLSSQDKSALPDGFFDS